MKIVELMYTDFCEVPLLFQQAGWVTYVQLS